MGVKGLQSFMERQCPDSCHRVSIEELANKHRNEYRCIPKLAIDGSALIYPLYSKTLEWIYGGQWTQFFYKLDRFIHRFNEIGVKLVFFFDGTVCSSKRKEWIKRRVSKYKEISIIFKDIKTNKFEPNKMFQLPTSMGTLTRFALKQLGAEVYQTDREADEVIASYAVSNFDVFGILSQDSDFLIFDTKPYLSLSHLNLNTLETILYDRNYLAVHYLNLYVTQLPLFACLVGNDIVPAEQLRHFHLRLSNKKGHRTYISDFAENIVNLIHSEQWIGDFRNEMELHNISWKVFGHSGLLSLIRDGLKSYAIGHQNSSSVCIGTDTEFETAVFSKHINCRNGPFIFNLLCNKEYESSEVLEDSSLFPSALKYRKIRQRCYGLLFNCYVQPKNNFRDARCTREETVLIKEWCAYEGNFMETPEYIDPLPLQNIAKIPSIRQLWFSSSEQERLQIFWSALQIPLDFKLLFTLPKHLIVLTCILNFLTGTQKENSELQAFEVAVFLAQALWKKKIESLENLKISRVDATAVHLSTLFMRGVSTVLMVLGTCGYPFDVNYAMPWHFFDGKLFHYLYLRTKENYRIIQLFDQEECKEQFYSLLPIVTNNTLYDTRIFDWKLIFDDF